MERHQQKPTNPVSGPYNYGWMTGVSLEWSNAVKDTLITTPSQIKTLSEIEEVWTRANESGVSLSGTARDLEIYLTSDTSAWAFSATRCNFPGRRSSAW